MLISIIIPTYNHLEDCLKPCLESIIKNTNLSDKEIIIVANGCNDGTAEYVRSLGKPFKLLEFKEALGYTKATNEGIKSSSGDYIVLLNNDCVILEWGVNKWIDLLISPFTTDDKMGITGAYKVKHPNTGIDFLLFFCVMIKKEIINKLGLLDEIFNPGYGEDIDYCKKISALGYKVEQVPDMGNNFPLWHKSSKTVHGVPKWEEIVQRNEGILKDRINSGYYKTKSGELLTRLKEEVPGLYQEIFEFNAYNVLPFEIKDKTVLDIGANRGYFSIFAQKAGAKEVYSFEPSSIYDKLLENISGIKNIHSVKAAVSKPNQKEGFLAYEGSNDLLTKTKEICPRLTSSTAGEKVKCMSLEDIVKDISDKDLVMKIDCEGSEYDIILHSDINTLKRFKYIYAEFHNDMHENNSYNFDMLEEYLKSNGYTSDRLKINGTVGMWTIENGQSKFTPFEIQENPQIRSFKFSRIDSKKISIIIPTYNHLEDCLKPCIESIIKNTDLSDKEIIIVANGCNDGTEDYVKSLGEPFKLLSFAEPLGYTKAVNEGLKVFKGEYVILLGNDCIILDSPKNQWIDYLKKPFQNQNVGISGPLKQVHPETKIEFMVFFCVMIKKEIINKLGLLDEIFNPGYGEDIDYCKKISELGYILEQVPNNDINQNFPIYHKAGQTVRHIHNWNKIVDKNTKILTDRYPKNIIKKRKIYDCSIFYNEPDMLELRLNILNDVVDYFVICESWHTFAGNPKSLYFYQYKVRFAKYMHKIIHLVVDKTITENIPGLSVEEIQRNYVYKALEKCSDDDIAILSDIDEIPNPDVIRNFKPDDLGMSSLSQKLYYYNMNCLSNDKWIDSKIGVWGKLKNIQPHTLRYVPIGWNNIKIINDAGWHFSHFGKIDDIMIKINTSHHQELNTEKINNIKNITESINYYKDLYGRDIKFNRVKIDNSYPKHVLNNINHYVELGFIKDRPTNKKYSIVIPTYNHLDDYLKPCIESIKKTTDLSQTEVIIVANGCIDDTKNYVESLGNDFRLIWSEKPLGYAKSVNAGIKASLGEFIILLNNDTVVLDRTWIELLEKPFITDRAVGITGPFLNIFTPTKHLWFAFFCNMITRDVFDKIGLLDEEFGVGSFEDIDFCIRAQQNGYKLTAASNDKIFEGDSEGRIYGEFPIFHVGGGTTTLLPDWKDITNKNYKIILKKHKDLIKDDIYNNYKEKCDQKSDINELLPVLKKYGEKCQTITEMGVRHGNSSWAFLASRPDSFICYDMNEESVVLDLKNASKNANISFTFYQEDVLKVQIKPTDLLFIDTLHTYDQLSAELKLHNKNVKKYIIMHDTETFAERGNFSPSNDIVYGPIDSGLQRAIEEFLQNNTEWKLKEQLKNCNGLTILEKI